jgi:indole-3-glycerol phosphate synthase
MKNILHEIVEYKKQELEITKQQVPLYEILEKIEKIKFEIKDFKSAISNLVDVNIIGEIKKASPSKGLFNQNLDLVSYAKFYEEYGVKAISVLTETKYFLGDPKYLKLVKDNVSIPVLRKDFIIDSYQIFESKILGADAILLIANILSEKMLKDFLHIAKSLKLFCLVETHTKEEIVKALNCGAEIIGINNRSLENFSVDINLTKRLCEYIPKDKIIVSESGINSNQDITNLRNLGVNAFLIGEAIVTNKNPKEKIKELIGK